MKLEKEFFERKDTIAISKDLLGKILCTKLEPQRVMTCGMIVETEAYCGIQDRGCHAYGDRRTPRTEIMYGEAGRSYIYLCYGIHSLFNVVTNEIGIPHAILIRAIEPIEGMEAMLKRRNITKLQYNLGSGPGNLARALGIHYSMSGMDLQSDRIWIEDRGIKIAGRQIISGPRVGMNFPGKYASIPWRFLIKDNPWTS